MIWLGCVGVAVVEEDSVEAVDENRQIKPQCLDADRNLQKREQHYTRTIDKVPHCQYSGCIT